MALVGNNLFGIDWSAAPRFAAPVAPVAAPQPAYRQDSLQLSSQPADPAFQAAMAQLNALGAQNAAAPASLPQLPAGTPFAQSAPATLPQTPYAPSFNAPRPSAFATSTAPGYPAPPPAPPPPPPPPVPPPVPPVPPPAPAAPPPVAPVMPPAQAAPSYPAAPAANWPAPAPMPAAPAAWPTTPAAPAPAMVNPINNSPEPNPADVEKLKDLPAADLKQLGKNDKQGFLEMLRPAAEAAERKYGVPAAVTLAQAALETGWGQHIIPGFNIFGIKGQGTAGSTSQATHEVVNGRTVSIKAGFAKYNNFFEAVDAHGKLFHNGHYDKAVNQYAQDHDPFAFARNITGIYATDPSYATKLSSIMRQYHLA